MTHGVISMLPGVPRWTPDAPGRLQLAAIDLFEQRGYEGTTVEDIASAAGVTKRTFFRHFGDKREVLFGTGDGFRDRCVEALEATAPDAPPLQAVVDAMRAPTGWFEERRDWSRRRSAVIASSPELRERELVKLAGIAEAFAAVLRHRGTEPVVAGLAAETGMAVWRTAFERWTAGEDDLAAQIDDAQRRLQAVAGA